jgi:[acyl-carrier-protein] S-malonyltransferase
MGKDLTERFAAAANVYARADRILGWSLSQLSFQGPAEQLTRTRNCQLALFVHGLAVLAVLREEVPKFQFGAAAGLSLGELTAHVAAETFDFETGLLLVAKRAQYMDEVCASTAGGMAACVGGEELAVRRLAQDTDTDVANLNAPSQIVLSGTVDGIEQAVSLARNYGIKRIVPLTVAGAFHSRLMSPAADKLRIDLETTAVATPRVAVVANVTAQPVREPSEIRETLAKQVSSSVLWTQTIAYLLDNEHCDLLVELGPGQVLAGLVQRIRKGAPTISIGDLPSLLESRSALEEAL